MSKVLCASYYEDLENSDKFAKNILAIELPYGTAIEIQAKELGYMFREKDPETWVGGTYVPRYWPEGCEKNNPREEPMRGILIKGEDIDELWWPIGMTTKVRLGQA